MLAPPWPLDLHLARDAKLPCHLSANLGNIQSCSPAKEMTTFVKLYVQGESSKMPVVYDRFGTNGLTILKNVTSIGIEH